MSKKDKERPREKERESKKKREREAKKGRERERPRKREREDSMTIPTRFSPNLKWPRGQKITMNFIHC